MSFILSNLVRRCKVGNKTYKAILRCLCDYADEAGRCFPSHASIIAEVECDKKIVTTALLFLEKDGWITIERHQKGNSNVYHVNVSKLNSAPENRDTEVPPKTGRPENGYTRKRVDSTPENGKTVYPKTGNEYINNISTTYQDICPQTESIDESKPQKQISCPQKKLIDLYHEKLPTLPQVRSWNSPARTQSMRSRWRFVMSEKKYTSEAEGLEWFSKFFEFCNRSPFLRGEGSPNRVTGRVFTPDLEWILKPSNFDKIIDGRYHQ